MEQLINPALLTFICVYVVDYSGIIVDLSKFIWGLRFPNKLYAYWIIPKPFSCSVCMTFWSVGIYLLTCGTPAILAIASACLCALSIDLFKKIINYYKLKANE
jgi:hypothetical protein